jgi:hypothetical protein
MESAALVFHRVANRTDVRLVLEQSGDGIAWSALATSTGGTAVAESAEVQVSESGSPQVRVTVTAPRSGARQFYRLAAQRVP